MNRTIRRLLGYGISAILALGIYVGSISILTSFALGSANELVFALLFSIYEGFGAALLLTAAPWAAVVWMSSRINGSRLIYFSMMGMILLFVISCVMSSLAPKPSWIEDQTFLEGVRMAAIRQGIPFLLSGWAFGASWWFLCERRSPPAVH